jgi:hypothetical protein
MDGRKSFQISLATAAVPATQTGDAMAREPAASFLAVEIESAEVTDDGCE